MYYIPYVYYITYKIHIYNKNHLGSSEISLCSFPLAPGAWFPWARQACPLAAYRLPKSASMTQSPKPLFLSPGPR